MALDTHEHVYLELEGESDRAVAVLSAAFLDHALESLLRKFFRKVRATDSLFEPMQPLSSFSARTKLSYVLGLIDARSYRDLNRIRKIRNVFAHDRSPRAFADDEISGQCAALEWPTILKGERCEPKTSRARFEAATQMMLGAIATLEHQAHAQKRVALDEQDFPADRTFSSHEVDLSTAVYDEPKGKTVSLTITYASAAPITITWDRVEPISELLRQFRILEAELSIGAG